MIIQMQMPIERLKSIIPRKQSRNWCDFVLLLLFFFIHFISCYSIPGQKSAGKLVFLAFEISFSLQHMNMNIEYK